MFCYMLNIATLMDMRAHYDDPDEGRWLLGSLLVIFNTMLSLLAAVCTLTSAYKINHDYGSHLVFSALLGAIIAVGGALISCMATLGYVIMFGVLGAMVGVGKSLLWDELHADYLRTYNLRWLGEALGPPSQRVLTR